MKETDNPKCFKGDFSENLKVKHLSLKLKIAFKYFTINVLEN